MKKIIISIDGESHILVGDTKEGCGECSLHDFCFDVNQDLCGLISDLYPDCIFKKLEEIKN